MRRPLLSKSRLIAARQCLKRVHLEVHHGELADVHPSTQQAFAVGKEVGRLARRIYATEGAITIPYDGGLAHALRKTERLLREPADFPIFEATLEHDGVLVRVDVLLPEEGAWRMVEVKAATELKAVHTFDCAVQSWVLRRAGYPLADVALAHVDPAFVYSGNGEYQGLLTERRMPECAAEFDDEMPAFLRDVRGAVSGEQPDVPVGAHCFKPHPCPFITHCWPTDVDHSLFELPRLPKEKMAEFVASGYRDLRDVPEDLLSATQKRVQAAVRRGTPEILPPVAETMRGLDYPRYYLDFETLNTPVPVFPGTAPYQALPFQWSCHFEAAPGGALEHAEFLDITGDPPFRRLAESLIRALGRKGPVLTWSPYEQRVLEELCELFPDLAQSLTAIQARLIDLEPVVRNNYYHPAMQGSWSIKAVLPQIAADLDYSELEEIQDGTAASSGYLEAIDPEVPVARKALLDECLRRYCRLDTAALHRIVEFFARE